MSRLHACPALISANAEPVGQSAGTWVRASERTADNDDVLHVKIDGIRYMGNFFDAELPGEKGFYVQSNGAHEGWIIEQHKFSGILWLDESILPSFGIMATGNYEKEWEDFWKEIVCNPDGSINVEQVKKELSDFSFVIEQVPKVYCHITDSLLSKVMYNADTVIRVADDRYNKMLEAELKEAAEDEDTLPDNREREALAINHLRNLCSLKQYKEERGEDSFYKEMQKAAWENVSEFLESLTNKP